MSSLQFELNDQARSQPPLQMALEDRHLSESPVFVDDAGRRRRLVRLVAVTLAAAAVLWLVAVVASFVGFRPLPIPLVERVRPEPAAAGSTRSAALREPDGGRSSGMSRSGAATPSTDGIMGVRMARRRSPARSGRAAPVERRRSRGSSMALDAAPAGTSAPPSPAPVPAGRPDGGSSAANAPQAPAPQVTTESAPATRPRTTPRRVTPTAPPEQRDERAAGDPAFGERAGGRPMHAGRPGS